jgi:hypothetical protein
MNARRFVRRVRLVVAVAALVSFVGITPARACFDVDTPPAPWIFFTNATTAEVALVGTVVEPTGLSIGDFCAAGLGHSNALITGITALGAYDEPDPTAGPVAIPGLAFSSNATTTSDLTTAAAGSTWAGFHSPVSAAIPAGTDVVLRFTITVAGGTTYQQIIDELQGFSFLGVDDSNASGNLLNTNQNIDGLVGAAELPECYDDVLQPGEVCDGLSDLGCVGQTCVDCSACATVGQAEDCKSKLIRDISKNAKKRLQCYAQAAKQALPVSPACLSPHITFLDTFVNFKYIPNCPQAIPPATTIENFVAALGNSLASTIAPLGVVGNETKCASKKFKAASFRAVGKIKCYSKAYAQNVPVNPACLTTVDTKYGTKYTQAENIGCAVGNVGNSGAIAAAADQFAITDIVGSIPPP